MSRVLEKTERRLGEKLFLKGDRCLGPKCAVTRRAYPPGAHGKKKRQSRTSSDFGAHLLEKQKVRFIYGLDDKDIQSYTKKAVSMSGIFSLNFLRLLETRLDNVVFRLGFAESRRKARQLVNHRHITVNNRSVSIPSYVLKKGEEVGIKERSLKSPGFSMLEAHIKKYQSPQWLKLDIPKKSGTILRIPEAEDIDLVSDVAKIKEFYSR